MKEPPTTPGDKKPADATMIVNSPSEADTSGSSRACLVILSGPEIGREITLQDCPLVIGRAASAQIYINAPSVSRQHARMDLVRDGDQEYYTLTDLGSSNGTFVNNTTAADTHVHHGDRIRMGDVIFKFILQDDVETRFHKDVHRLIHYDQLTGLLTMNTFRSHLDGAIRRDEDSAACFSLAMTDLDGLKKVNDTWGHLAGRMVIREMGSIIRHTLRPFDLAGLYGGDECIIFFPDTPLNSAAAVAELLRENIAQRVFDYQDAQFQVSISQGLAEWPRHGSTAEELIAAADQALYRAKKDGRNRVCRADML